jgi:hypothetical protein
MSFDRGKVFYVLSKMPKGVQGTLSEIHKICEKHNADFCSVIFKLFFSSEE